MYFLQISLGNLLVYLLQISSGRLLLYLLYYRLQITNLMAGVESQS